MALKRTVSIFYERLINLAVLTLSFTADCKSSLHLFLLILLTLFAPKWKFSAYGSPSFVAQLHSEDGGLFSVLVCAILPKCSKIDAQLVLRRRLGWKWWCLIYDACFPRFLVIGSSSFPPPCEAKHSWSAMHKYDSNREKLPFWSQ